MAETKSYKVLMALMAMDIGGVETQIVELCKALAAKGVILYAASDGGVYEETLKSIGVKVFYAPLATKNPISIISAYKILKKIIIENNIHLVHAHARIPAFVCNMLKNNLSGTPYAFKFITTVHRDYSTFPIYKLFTSWGEKTISVSHDLKQYLIKHYHVPEHNIFMTVNGIDTQKFVPSTKKALKKFKITTVSRMDKDMSAPALMLINIAKKITAKINNAEIILVGSGEDLPELKRRAEEENKKIGHEAIFVLGKRTDIAEILAETDVFVGVSRSALEAMSACLPVVLAGSQGYGGIFTEEKLEAGILTNFCFRGCAETTEQRIYNDILSLHAMNTADRSRLGEFGRKIVCEKYSVEKMAGDVLAVYDIMRKPSRPNDVLISGYYGSNNHGDDALLKAITDDLRKIKPDIKITVTSLRPKSTHTTYNVDAVHKFNFIEILNLLKKTNLLISGGGTLVQDLTSSRSLYYYLFVMAAAKRAGCKVTLYANGIGPVLKPHNRKLAAKILQKADLITLRDNESEKVLREIGVTVPVTVAADAAFGLKNNNLSAGQKLINELGLKKGSYICVNLRSWKYTKQHFVDAVITFANYVYSRYNLKTVFIPMQKIYDYEISKQAVGKIESATIIERDFSADELLGLCADAVFLAGMRLHSIIYAFKAGTPAIGIAYDPKVKAVIEEFGQKFCADVAYVTAEQLKSFADEIITNRSVISAQISEKSAELAKKSFLNAECAVALLNENMF